MSAKQLTIFKYPLLNWLGGECSIVIPAGVVLDVQMQNDMPYLWAMHEVGAKPNVRLRYLFLGTGMVASESELKECSYVKTLQHGPFVWHVFNKHGLELVGEDSQ